MRWWFHYHCANACETTGRDNEIHRRSTELLTDSYQAASHFENIQDKWNRLGPRLLSCIFILDPQIPSICSPWFLDCCQSIGPPP